MQGALSPPVGTRRPSARFAHVQILSQGDAARPREENFAFHPSIIYSYLVRLSYVICPFKCLNTIRTVQIRRGT